MAYASALSRAAPMPISYGKLVAPPRSMPLGRK
jgi:hypothetical protein